MCGYGGCKVRPCLFHFLLYVAHAHVEAAVLLNTSSFTTSLHAPPPSPFRGSGDSHQLGHGDTEHVRTPRQVDALSEQVVVDIAVGSQHCLALTASGDLFGWGKNSSGEVNPSVEATSLPVYIPETSGKGASSIACGAFEVKFPAYSAHRICSMIDSQIKHVRDQVYKLIGDGTESKRVWKRALDV